MKFSCLFITYIGDVTFGWDTMKKYPQIQTVRIEIEPDKVSKGRQWVEESVANGYDVIVTYHNSSVLGTDDPNALATAAQWWVINYNEMRKSGPFTVNLMNEWGSHKQTPQTYSSAYNDAISRVREVYSGPIVIDIPGWGQETHTAALSSPMLSDKNLILSAHVYPNGWNEAAGHSLCPDDMDELINTGRPCLIGEFGTEGAGSVDVKAVVNRAKSVGFDGVFAWAWNGDGGVMNMVDPAWYNNPKATSYTTNSYFQDLISLL